jgi:hypothetical protein
MEFLGDLRARLARANNQDGTVGQLRRVLVLAGMKLDEVAR